MHNGFFWKTAPSPLLAGGATLALSLSTTLSCIWPEGRTDKIPAIGLARAGVYNYKIWPLWIWLYCILWWFIQDAAKIVTYHLMEKYDIFQYRTGTFVNLRGASSVVTGDKLASHTAGVVEKKVLVRKMDSALEAMERITKISGGKAAHHLERISNSLATKRSNFNAKVPVTQQPGVGMDVEGTIGEIESAIRQTGDSAAMAEARASIDGLRHAARNLERVSAALQEQLDSARGPGAPNEFASRYMDSQEDPK